MQAKERKIKWKRNVCAIIAVAGEYIKWNHYMLRRLTHACERKRRANSIIFASATKNRKTKNTDFSFSALSLSAVLQFQPQHKNHIIFTMIVFDWANCPLCLSTVVSSNDLPSTRPQRERHFHGARGSFVQWLGPNARHCLVLRRDASQTRATSPKT